jgi:hypothetical protein
MYRFLYITLELTSAHSLHYYCGACLFLHARNFKAILALIFSDEESLFGEKVSEEVHIEISNGIAI